MVHLVRDDVVDNFAEVECFILQSKFKVATLESQVGGRFSSVSVIQKFRTRNANIRIYMGATGSIQH